MYTVLKAEWATLRDAVELSRSELRRDAYATPPKPMVELLIAGEDHRFLHHPGVDPVALCRALWKTIRGSRQGGSTVAMQLARTITGRYEMTLERKMREIVLALLLTRYFGKADLPPLYLHIAYYGWKMNGFRQACRRLGIEPGAMSQFDAAKLVARLKYPEPRFAGIERTRQIERRAKHLIFRAQRLARRDPSGALETVWSPLK
jgi:membrane carboxypeptidase/penicillin-binding protein PbpC